MSNNYGIFKMVYSLLKNIHASFSMTIGLIFNRASSSQTFHINNQITYIQTVLGINIYETADILQITRRAISDWRSAKAFPSVKNQERIHKLITICKKWENTNLGPIKYFTRKHMGVEYSILELLCKDDLDTKFIFAYFNRIKSHMEDLNKERLYIYQTRKKYGFNKCSKT